MFCAYYIALDSHNNRKTRLVALKSQLSKSSLIVFQNFKIKRSPFHYCSILCYRAMSAGSVSTQCALVKQATVNYNDSICTQEIIVKRPYMCTSFVVSLLIYFRVCKNFFLVVFEGIKVLFCERVHSSVLKFLNHYIGSIESGNLRTRTRCIWSIILRKPCDLGQERPKCIIGDRM